MLSITTLYATSVQCGPKYQISIQINVAEAEQQSSFSRAELAKCLMHWEIEGFIQIRASQVRNVRSSFLRSALSDETYSLNLLALSNPEGEVYSSGGDREAHGCLTWAYGGTGGRCRCPFTFRYQFRDRR